MNDYFYQQQSKNYWVIFKKTGQDVAVRVPGPSYDTELKAFHATVPLNKRAIKALKPASLWRMCLRPLLEISEAA